MSLRRQIKVDEPIPDASSRLGIDNGSWSAIVYQAPIATMKTDPKKALLLHLPHS
ncbi:unnamed protein product [Sphenostylis stenocarpa]|uniref:Uncharacterized protein n=1 Tax=Sphenostylis stenocarpa TaxID=92480 RepID=A0AA86T6I8_9FABA|nr:unnamed protein product [Sphenostylis stenocarpa]